MFLKKNKKKPTVITLGRGGKDWNSLPTDLKETFLEHFDGV